ncbi:amino acid ABC transporter substrate-binding protein, PAAT family (TC 3.A.1.3.-) [Roseomonas rosea]|uniref:Amino acid ABC transporter substrate-binding protein, PAAT family (TC 3.A.1.3.-) n=1 Tax=Muricoccus roseus TaxID=198092 RepID=A0A1M6GDV5_9PROT|nr:amino acid ABC transporter substrate-binding protein [Roseomonas rosea]SHJ08110.1 amino acid ABC transporter substrate-binding protein, PAAT family (TC 3.A.1.3.-) [Roseomonas rosea]
MGHATGITMKRAATRALAAGLTLAAIALGAAGQASSATLDTVRARGRILCGVGESFPGFFAADSNGRWQGLDVDFCRALAAAVLGDAEKVTFAPATPVARFPQLQSGEVDLLSRSVTWTLSRDAALGLHFVGVTFHDGQGFMVRKALGVAHVSELRDATICTQSGTTTERNLADWFRARGIGFSPVVFETAPQAVAAYESGRCDAYTTDRSTLQARLGAMQDPAAHVILPETITSALNGPVVRQGDGQWANIVRWTLNALIGAEARGITSANAEQLRATSTHPETRRMLGAEGGLGRMLGLSDSWAYEAIRQVGNYAEIYERNLGPGARVQIPRAGGPNRLAVDGGLLVAPAFE